MEDVEVAGVDEPSGAMAMMIRPAVEMASFQKGDYTIEKVVKLPEGALIEGIFAGEGGTVEVTDPNDPSKKQPLRSWKIRSADGSMTAVLLGTAQLNSTFSAPGLVGKKCFVARLGKTRSSNGRIVNDYVIGWGKATQGDLFGEAK